MSLAKRLAARQDLDRRSIEVPEWGEDEASPQVVYYGPFLAIEMDKVQRKHPNFLQSMTMAGMVEIIVMKAEDKDGNKLFGLDDKPTLMREPLTLITRIAGAFMSSGSVEEQEKN
jgi:hypothetical protein